MAPSSQELEPPQKPGRFSSLTDSDFSLGLCTLMKVIFTFSTLKLLQFFITLDKVEPMPKMSLDRAVTTFHNNSSVNILLPLR
jgi:hypothetical protein